MRVLMLVLCVFAVLYAAAVTITAKSAVHEIQAGVALVVAAVLFAGAGICSALDRLRADLLSRSEVQRSDGGQGSDMPASTQQLTPPSFNGDEKRTLYFAVAFVIVAVIVLTMLGRCSGP